MNRTEVRDRVGGLLLLPNTDLATTKQVAEFYGVDKSVIKMTMTRHSEEFLQNGANKLTYQDISNEISKGNNLFPLEN